MKNLAKIKKDKKNTIKYGTLILCLFFFFMNEVLGIGNVQWAYDRLIAIQIRELLYSIGDNKARKATLWGYFKNIQSLMHDRERIPKIIVKKYKDTICFMVDTDQCLMEEVEPRKV